MTTHVWAPLCSSLISLKVCGTHILLYLWPFWARPPLSTRSSIIWAIDRDVRAFKLERRTIFSFSGNIADFSTTCALLFFYISVNAVCGYKKKRLKTYLAVTAAVDWTFHTGILFYYMWPLTVDWFRITRQTAKVVQYHVGICTLLVLLYIIFFSSRVNLKIRKPFAVGRYLIKKYVVFLREQFKLHENNIFF